MQCVFSFGNRSVPNAKIVALSEINLAFGLKNGPAQQGTMAVALMAHAAAAKSACVAAEVLCGVRCAPLKICFGRVPAGLLSRGECGTT